MRLTVKIKQSRIEILRLQYTQRKEIAAYRGEICSS